MRLATTLLAGSALALSATIGTAEAGPNLDAIKSKGFIQCGVSTGLAGFSNPDDAGTWAGLDVDVCRGVAAAVFGDADAVKFTPLTAKERFTALQSGEVDVLSRNTTWTLNRDTALGFDFTGVTYYDGQGFMVPTALGVKSALELDGALDLRAARHHHRAQSRGLFPRQQHELRAGGHRAPGGDPDGLRSGPLRRLHDRPVGPLRRAHGAHRTRRRTSSCPRSSRRSRSGRWCATATTSGPTSSVGRCTPCSRPRSTA